MSLGGYKSAAQSLVTDMQSEIAKTGALVARIRRYVKDASISDFSDIVDTTSLSSAFQSAVDNSSTLLDNPLANMIDKEFAGYGITTANVVAIAQSLMRGDESPMLQVIVAMITFPARAQEFITAAKKMHEGMSGIATMLRSVPGAEDLQRSDHVSVPLEIIVQIETIRNNLTRSMSHPFNTKLYTDNMYEIINACEALEQVEWLKNAKNSTAAMAAILSLNSMAVLVAPAGKIVTDLGLRLLSDINIMLTADLSIRSKSSAKFNTAKKAVARISQVLSQMNNADVDQLMLIPKYISILNVAYMLLKTGQPAPDTDPLDFDRTKIRLQATTIQSIQSSCRKLVVFTQTPYKLSALDAELGRLGTYISQFESEYALTIAGIQEIEDAGFADKFNLIRLMFEYLEDYAMATSLLADGQFSAFLDLNEMTATAEGAVTAAMSELATLCDMYYMPRQAAWFRKKSAEFSKKTKSKQLKTECKKEKRKNKANEKLKELNVLAEDALELYATVAGVATTIASFTE